MPTKIKRTERKAEFRALDGAGNWHTVVVFQQVIDVGTTLDRNAERLGIKILQTAEGKPIYRVRKGVYEIVDRPRVRIVSDDPNAP